MSAYNARFGEAEFVINMEAYWIQGFTNKVDHHSAYFYIGIK